MLSTILYCQQDFSLANLTQCENKGQCKETFTNKTLGLISKHLMGQARRPSK